MPHLPRFVYVIATFALAFALASLILGPRRALALWKRFGQELGDLVARLALTVFYCTVFIPFAVVARLGRG